MATWLLMLGTCWVLVVLLHPGVADNQAVGRPAWQSSDRNNFTVAATAADGNPYLVPWKPPYCSHTIIGEPGPQWWIVDLQRDVLISSVTIYNRNDCCTTSLKQFHLELHEKNPHICGNITMVTSIYQNTALPAGPTNFTFDPALTARWVQVIMKGALPTLTLCEVEVFGEPLTKDVPCKRGRFRPLVLPQLPSLTTHASLSVGNVRHVFCASLCLRHNQCLGFYSRPVVGGPPACTLMVPRPPGAPVEAGLADPVTYFELIC